MTDDPLEVRYLGTCRVHAPSKHLVDSDLSGRLAGFPRYSRNAAGNRVDVSRENTKDSAHCRESFVPAVANDFDDHINSWRADRVLAS